MMKKYKIFVWKLVNNWSYSKGGRIPTAGDCSCSSAQCRIWGDDDAAVSSSVFFMASKFIIFRGKSGPNEANEDKSKAEAEHNMKKCRKNHFTLPR